MDSEFLKNLCFAKKHNKKGVKKMQANNAKAMSAHAESTKTLLKPKEVKLKTPNSARCKLGKHAHACLAKGLRPCQPNVKAKAQT